MFLQPARSLDLAEEFLQTSRAEILDSRRFEELDLGGLLHQAVDSAFDFPKSRRAKLARAIPDDPVWVRGDFGLLERATFNLAQNAVKYTLPDTRVEVKLSAHNGAARIEVRDHGPGIPAEQLPLLFRRFSRLEAGAASGAGLGLYFVHVTAIKHGRRAWAESQLGNGASFFLEIALA